MKLIHNWHKRANKAPCQICGSDKSVKYELGKKIVCSQCALRHMLGLSNSMKGL